MQFTSEQPYFVAKSCGLHLPGHPALTVPVPHPTRRPFRVHDRPASGRPVAVARGTHARAHRQADRLTDRLMTGQPVDDLLPSLVVRTNARTARRTD